MFKVLSPSFRFPIFHTWLEMKAVVRMLRFIISTMCLLIMGLGEVKSSGLALYQYSPMQHFSSKECWPLTPVHVNFFCYHQTGIPEGICLPYFSYTQKRQAFIKSLTFPLSKNYSC